MECVIDYYHFITFADCRCGFDVTVKSTLLTNITIEMSKYKKNGKFYPDNGNVREWENFTFYKTINCECVISMGNTFYILFYSSCL